ncbi:hypothetical protein DSM107007_44630 [Nostoc sp. PCC 7120 = FACHB-418]|nr:hypothetical protein DSM107007_44630 [Nostoc sp. PCC 7120 = FACHB-418]
MLFCDIIITDIIYLLGFLVKIYTPKKGNYFCWYKNIFISSYVIVNLIKFIVSLLLNKCSYCPIQGLFGNQI